MVFPSNGGFPNKSIYRMTPSDHRSALQYEGETLVSILPAALSGAIKYREDILLEENFFFVKPPP